MSSRTLAVAAAVLGFVAVTAPSAPAVADSLRSAEPFYDVSTGQYVSIDGKAVTSAPSLSMTK